MSEKVVYEQHPVSAERKAELRQKGYKIIDAKFAPEGYEHPEPSKEAKVSKADAKKAAAEAKQKAELQDALKAKGIEFSSDASLEDLLKLIEAK
ncbi:hypothetical protein [Pseudomonas kurunegalensis]|uniref:hypothetical protein n=1 Tax=Pseudomonas kurunegalensis TaxID=485880 RepID=UPI002118B6CA|nr:hypothetical protein [Pseudomonas kurunegalensis]